MDFLKGPGVNISACLFCMGLCELGELFEEIGVEVRAEVVSLELAEAVEVGIVHEKARIL